MMINVMHLFEKIPIYKARDLGRYGKIVYI